MPGMFCPKCGRELELDSAETRFCRYCGFALSDTKDALHGYSEQKRVGFSVVTWSFALLLIITLLLHGRYVSLDTGWIYWLLTILMVVSVSLFVSAAVSALKPSMFSKTKRDHKSQSDRQSSAAHTNPLGHDKSLPAFGEPITDFNGAREDRKPIEHSRSVVEGTTRKLND